MGKAYVFNQHLGNKDRATIEGAVEAAGYNAVYTVPADASSVNPEANIGVVGLPVAPADSAVVNARMQAFAGAGIRVVGIWLRGEEGSGIGVPEGIAKYATTVDINSAELTNTLKGDIDIWEQPGGALSQAPETKRNKC